MGGGHLVVLQKLVRHLNGHEELGEVCSLLQLLEPAQSPVHDRVHDLGAALDQALPEVARGGGGGKEDAPS